MSGVLHALAIAAAGGVGAALRYGVDAAVAKNRNQTFPWALLIVNLTGSFVLGVLTGLALGLPVAELLGVGLLGGYTTFSSASLDTAKLLAARRFKAALANGAGVLVAAVGCAILGIALGSAL